MPLSSKERAELRGEAHHLVASVHVGQHGLTETLKQTLDDALRTHELVKIQFGRNADVDSKEAANELAASMNADVVQVIKVARPATLKKVRKQLGKAHAVYLRRFDELLAAAELEQRKGTFQLSAFQINF